MNTACVSASEKVRLKLEGRQVGLTENLGEEWVAAIRAAKVNLSRFYDNMERQGGEALRQGDNV